VIAAGATLAILATVGLVAASASSSTAVSLYHAFTASGAIVPRVRVLSGECDGPSGATQRDDAWRCISGNGLYDPCFSSTHAAGVVICPLPWEAVAVELRLTTPLESKVRGPARPSLELQPWAIETDTGAKCVVNSGMGTVIDNKRNNYYCGVGSHATVLWGYPNQNHEPWTMPETPATATTLKGDHLVTLRHVWM
jgi:hypothetical protein